MEVQGSIASSAWLEGEVGVCRRSLGKLTGTKDGLSLEYLHGSFGMRYKC